MQAQPIKDTIPDDIRIYHLALTFADYEVAKSAMFSLIVKNPSRIDYLDPLARIYFSMNAYPQCLAAAEFVLKSQPDNQQMLEITAICQRAMKNEKEALAVMKSCTPNLKAFIIYTRLPYCNIPCNATGECAKSIEAILADKDSANQKIQIS